MTGSLRPDGTAPNTETFADTFIFTHGGTTSLYEQSDNTDLDGHMSCLFGILLIIRNRIFLAESDPRQNHGGGRQQTRQAGAEALRQI